MKHGAHLTLLRTFLWVYRCRGVARAAGLLGLSQPAVSRHLQSLESLMGRTLFERMGRGVAPTQTAHLLAARIATHLDALEKAAEALTPAATDAPVLLGAPSDLLSIHLVPRLSPLLDSGMEVHCRIGQASELTRALLHGDLDLVVMTEVEQDLLGQLALRRLCEEEFVLVGRVGEAPYQVGDDPRRFVGYSPAMPMARHYFRTCWRAQPPVPALTVADLRAVVSAVEAGCGLGVVPRYVAQEALDAGRLSVLHTPSAPVLNSVFVAARLGREDIARLRAVLDLLCPAD
ncbi:LysR family transcriptional regulator [Streptomyces sp. NPDC101110]|uniref:LysR family transcriptional regulator n=1 Tax=unclassified Streptomyces TaxID=2593676 RepID=UPI00381C162E